MSDDTITLEDISFIRLEYNKNELLHGLGVEVYKGKFISNNYPDGKDATIRKFTAPTCSSSKNERTDNCKHVLDAYFRERKRDLELLRKPDHLHENFIRYICHIKKGDSFYVATESCQWSVSDLFNKNSKDKETVQEIRQQLGAVEILRQSTEGLSFLHGFGYIHRNLEPVNFWVAIYEQLNNKTIYQIKISDFRNSKNIKVNLNNSGTKTEEWFAPECVVNGTVSHISADVFVLAMYYFYVLFGGRHPFSSSGYVYDIKKRSLTICQRIQDKNDKVHNWAAKADDVALISDIPWDKRQLTAWHDDTWRNSVDFQQCNDELLKSALRVIKGMLNWDPSERWTLKQVTQDDFFQSKKADKRYEIYAPNDKKPGLCLIFCNYDFGIRQNYLEGWKTDGKQLEETFKNLGFDVHVRNNYTAKNMEMAIEKIAKDETLLNGYNCLTVCFLSHGSSGIILGSDANPISISKMQRSFNSHDCRAMHDKPKIFLVNACRVQNFFPIKDEKYTSLCDKVVNGEELSVQEQKEFKFYRISLYENCNDLLWSTEPSFKEECKSSVMPVSAHTDGKMNPNMSPVNDMITILPTAYGTPAMTYYQNVSFFTKYLCEALNRQERDLESILCQVQKRMQSPVSIRSNLNPAVVEPFVQTPERTSSLRMAIWLQNVGKIIGKITKFELSPIDGGTHQLDVTTLNETSLEVDEVL